MMRPIDADALLDKTVHMAKECFGVGQCYCLRTQFQKMVKDALTIDVVPVKRGHWIIDTSVHNIWGGTCVECSECKTRYVVLNIADEKYCRNCGADMTGGFDETH